MSSETKKPSIVRIPKIIWADEVQNEIEEENRLCVSGLVRIAQILENANVDSEDGDIDAFVDNLENIRQYLNFVDQKLEIISDLAQYLITERSENNGSSN